MWSKSTDTDLQIIFKGWAKFWNLRDLLQIPFIYIYNCCKFHSCEVFVYHLLMSLIFHISLRYWRLYLTVLKAPKSVFSPHILPPTCSTFPTYLISNKKGKKWGMCCWHMTWETCIRWCFNNCFQLNINKKNTVLKAGFKTTKVLWDEMPWKDFLMRSTCLYC